MLQKHYCLGTLLPYDIDKNEEGGALLRNRLKEYAMLTSVSLEALKALEAGDLKKFDPPVGENACEIRAVWIAIIASKGLIKTHDLLKKMGTIQNHIHKLLQPKAIAQLMRSGISLMNLCQKENLFISLSLEEIFLIQSFLLTETTITRENSMSSLCIKEKCELKKIKRFGNISLQFAKNLLSKFRKSVAVASVQFVKEYAGKLQDQSLIDMLSDEFTILHNNHLLCTPMFWTYKAVLAAIQAEQIPLVIYAKFLKKEDSGYRVIDQDLLFFEPEVSPSQDFKLKEATEQDYNKAACIVQGIVLFDQEEPLSKLQWRQTLLQYPISTVILAGAADHRQYPNVEQDERIRLLQNHEYETYKSLAQTEGFSLDNPKIFFIQHVYASVVGSVMSMKKKLKKSLLP